MNWPFLTVISVVCMLLLAYIAVAQTPVVPRKQPQSINGYLVVAACGTLPAPAYVAGNYVAATIDTTGKLCTSQ